MEPLGTILKAYRLVNDSSTSKVAKSLKKSSAYLSSIEANHKSPSLSFLRAVSSIYQVPVSEFFRLQELTEENHYSYQQLLAEVVKSWLHYNS